MCWFFFFKQKTAYEMRISDWSSDVCSSDLQSYHDQRGRKKAGHWAKNIRCNAHARVLTVSHPGNLTLLRCRPLIRSNGSGLLPPLPTGYPILRQIRKAPDVRDTSGAPAQIALQILTVVRSEEHTSELQSLMRISYAVFCLKKKNHK